MAVERAITPVSRQFALLAGVRWQVFRNSLLKRQKQQELIFKVLFWLSALSMVVIGGLVFFAATYFLFPKKPGMLIAIFWVLFVVWQIVPLLLEGQSPALDFREIARYPIPFRLYFFLSVAYGMLDPAAVIASAWALCAWAGVVLVKPAIAPRITLAFALFAVLNLFMNRVVFAWFAKLTQTRRGRERVMAVSLIFAVCMQVVLWLMPRNVERYPWLPGLIRAVNHALPPAWAVDIVLGDNPAFVRGSIAMFAATIAFAALFAWLCRRTFAGESASEGARRSGAVQVSPGWKVPLLNDATSAVLEKEIRYVLKDPRVFTNLITVWVFCFISAAGSGMMKDAFHLDISKSGNTLYPAMIGYSLLVINMMSFNCFGQDPPGFQRWLLSPLPMRQILIAKNLAFGTLVVLNLLMVTVIMRLGAAIPLSQFIKTALGLAYVALTMTAIGNVLSVWFPKKVEPGKISGKNVSEAAIVISMFTLGLLGASWFAVVVIATRTHIDWLPYAAFAVFVALAAWLYSFSLVLAPAFLVKRMDRLMTELG